MPATPKISPRWDALARLCALGTFLLIGLATILALDVPESEEVRSMVDIGGTRWEILFILAFAILILFPIPSSIPTVAAGFVLGFGQGVLATLIASMVAALLSYWLGRTLGGDAVDQFTGPTARRRIRAVLSRSGLWAIFLLRALPIMPFWLVNYASGAMGVRLRDYVAGTFLGTIPGTLAFAAVGTWGARPDSWQFPLAVIGLAALFLITWRAARAVVAEEDEYALEDGPGPGNPTPGPQRSRSGAQ